MLVVLLGLSCCGKNTIASHLERTSGFQRVELDGRANCLTFPNAAAFLDHATLHWKQLFVTTCALSKEDLAAFRKRPWVLLLHIDAPCLWRYALCLAK
jgi:dephospho-CoA kinase